MKRILLFLVLCFSFIGYTQCTYTGTPLTQVGSVNTFCIDNSNTITTTTVNAGQYVAVNVVKGFNYTFSVGNVFSTLNENLTILDFSTNSNVSPAAFSSGASGTSLNWTSSLSGQIKILLSAGSCVNNGTTGGAITLVLNSIGNTQDSQTTAGIDQWIGHVYNWTGTTPPGGYPSPSTPPTTIPFDNSNYVGYYTIPSETIAEGFGGNTACFPVYSNGTVRTNIYTERFAVRYRMISTKVGCYLANFNGDDGLRVYIDGVKVYDEWKEQAPTTYTNVLFYLTTLS